jgi:hypothetical protein
MHFLLAAWAALAGQWSLLALTNENDHSPISRAASNTTVNLSDVNKPCTNSTFERGIGLNVVVKSVGKLYFGIATDPWILDDQKYMRILNNTNDFG